MPLNAGQWAGNGQASLGASNSGAPRTIGNVPDVTSSRAVSITSACRQCLLLPSRFSGAPHSFFTLSNLNINSDQVRLTARSNGPWTFIDEVRFETSPVPEPEAYAMLLAGLGLLGTMVRRRKASAA